MQSGNIAMIYAAGISHISTEENHIRFTDDYGDTWTDEDTALDDSSVSTIDQTGEPYLIDAPNGDLLLMLGRTIHLGQGTYMQRSTDFGKTWDSAAALSITIDPGDGDANYLNAIDDHFIYDGDIYLSGRISDDASQSNTRSCLLKSTDNGATWTWVSKIMDGCNEVGIEYLGNNTIQAVMRSNSMTRTPTKRSTDMGATWAHSVDITGYVGFTGKHRLYTANHLQQGANWWTDTKLIACCFQHIPDPLRRNVIILSPDGVTWYKTNLDTYQEDGGYGDLFYNPITGEYVLMSYAGEYSNGNIKQYNFTVSW